MKKFIDKFSITYPVLSDVGAESVKSLGLLNDEFKPGDSNYGVAYPGVVIVNPPAGSGSASASAITATTNQQLPNTPVPSPGFLKQVRSWREQVR